MKKKSHIQKTAFAAGGLASLFAASSALGTIRHYTTPVEVDVTDSGQFRLWDLDPSAFLGGGDGYVILRRQTTANSALEIYKYSFIGFLNDNSQPLKISNLGLNATVGPGATYHPGGTFAGFGLYTVASNSTLGSRLPGWTSGVDGYAGFVLKANTTPIYGWAKFNIVADGVNNTFTVVEWAFQDSGASIKTGQITESPPVPEPATNTAIGLGALALGAAGLRRWRASKKQKVEN